MNNAAVMAIAAVLDHGKTYRRANLRLYAANGKWLFWAGDDFPRAISGSPADPERFSLSGRISANFSTLPLITNSIQATWGHWSEPEPFPEKDAAIAIGVDSYLYLPFTTRRDQPGRRGRSTASAPFDVNYLQVGIPPIENSEAVSHRNTFDNRSKLKDRQRDISLRFFCQRNSGHGTPKNTKK